MEKWKEIKGYEGLYEVSNTGYVRSVERDVIYSNGRIVHYKGKLISPAIHQNGYYAVTLHKGNKKRTYKVHRLVAQAFIPNPNNYPIINHKDENKSNNNMDNLEWCTAKYNSNYGNAQIKKASSCYKPIYQLNLDGEIINLWNSSTEVENKLGIKRTSISQCIANRSKTSGGFVWRFK